MNPRLTAEDKEELNKLMGEKKHHREDLQNPVCYQYQIECIAWLVLLLLN